MIWVSILFEFADGNTMINATEMARPFGKLVGGFLRSKNTKEYILLLEKRYADLHNGQKEVLRVVQGGNAKLQHEKLVFKFATFLTFAP